jgi:hypothetical protein
MNNVFIRLEMGSIQAVIEFDPVTHVQRLAAKKSQVLTVTFNGQGHYMCCRRKTLPNTCDTRQACYVKGYDGRTKQAIYYMLSFCLIVLPRLPEQFDVASEVTVMR